MKKRRPAQQSPSAPLVRSSARASRSHRGIIAKFTICTSQQDVRQGTGGGTTPARDAGSGRKPRSPSRTGMGRRWWSVRESAAAATLNCSPLAGQRSLFSNSLCAPSPLAVRVGVLELERASSSLSIDKPKGLRMANLSCAPRLPGLTLMCALSRIIGAICQQTARKHPLRTVLGARVPKSRRGGF